MVPMKDGYVNVELSSIALTTCQELRRWRSQPPIYIATSRLMAAADHGIINILTYLRRHVAVDSRAHANVGYLQSQLWNRRIMSSVNCYKLYAWQLHVQAVWLGLNLGAQP